MGDDFTQERRQQGQAVRGSEAQPSQVEVSAKRGKYLESVLGPQKVEQLMSYRYLEEKKKKEEFMQKGVIGPMDVRIQETGLGGFEISYDPKTFVAKIVIRASVQFKDGIVAIKGVGALANHKNLRDTAKAINREYQKRGDQSLRTRKSISRTRSNPINGSRTIRHCI